VEYFLTTPAKVMGQADFADKMDIFTGSFLTQRAQRVKDAKVQH
jgi:hypothetical protein